MNNTPTDQTSANSSASAGIAAMVVLMVFFGFVLWILVASRPSASESRTVAQVTEETPLPSPTKLTSLPTEVPPTGYTGELVSQGSSYFGASCSGCHGSDARGVAGLGKNLVESEFMSGVTDDELHDFIVTGRSAFDPANTTGIEMPPRGGNPALTDENIYQIIAYLRTQADPSLLVQGGAGSDTSADQDAAQTTAESTAAPEIAASPTFTPTPQDDSTPEPTVVFVPREFDPAEVYNLTCAGCHGIDGEGVEGFGPAIIDSSLLDDPAALLEFLTNGIPDANVVAGDFHHPLSNSSIYTDEADELQALIDYLQTLDEE